MINKQLLFHNYSKNSLEQNTPCNVWGVGQHLSKSFHLNNAFKKGIFLLLFLSLSLSLFANSYTIDELRDKLINGEESVSYTADSGENYNLKLIKAEKESTDVKYSWPSIDLPLRYYLNGELVSTLEPGTIEVVESLNKDSIATFNLEAQDENGSWYEYAKGGVALLSVEKKENNYITILQELVKDGETTLPYTDDNGNTYNLKLIPTTKNNLDVKYFWPESNNTLRYLINGSFVANIEEGKSEVILTDLPSNTLTLFVLEAESEDGLWSEYGKVGIIPVKVNKEINRRFALSAYFIGSLQILGFNTSVVNTGLGAKIMCTIPVNKNVSIAIDSNYQWIKYFEKEFNELSVMAKLRFNTNINSPFNAFVQLGGGENFVFKGQEKAYYPMISTAIGFDYYFVKNVAASVLCEYSMSFQPDSVNNHLTTGVGLSVAF